MSCTLPFRKHKQAYSVYQPGGDCTVSERTDETAYDWSPKMKDTILLQTYHILPCNLWELLLAFSKLSASQLLMLAGVETQTNLPVEGEVYFLVIAPVVGFSLRTLRV